MTALRYRLIGVRQRKDPMVAWLLLGGKLTLVRGLVARDNVLPNGGWLVLSWSRIWGLMWRKAMAEVNGGWLVIRFQWGISFRAPFIQKKGFNGEREK